MSGAARSLPSSSTVLGAGSRFVGDLTGDEDVVINGRLEGTIRVERRVTVGPEAHVEGNVRARQVVVSGRVHGEVVAGERAELTSSAVVEGSVQAPKIVIAEGARLEGSVATSAEGEKPGKGSEG